MSAKTVKVSKKVAVSVMFDMVTIQLICGDEYAAQVTYDDIIDRLRRGEGLTLSVEQKQSVSPQPQAQGEKE